MRLTRTAIIGIHPCFQFVSAQQPVCFRHGPFPMNPFRFNGVEPWTFAGQVAHHEAHADGAPFDLLIVLTYPVAHGLATVPGRIVPDQQQGGEALSRKLCRAPRQEINRDGTHRTSRDKPQPHLVGLLWPWPQQQAITGQGLGIRIVRGRGQFLSFRLGLGFCPTMLIALGEPTPPDLIAKAQRPRGPGLVIQCLARFQDTPNRRRATRMASSLTKRGVRPWAKLTLAASWRVHRLVGWPKVRGLWCSSARRDSQVPASKIVAVECGRDERGCNTARPRRWKA